MKLKPTLILFRAKITVMNAKAPSPKLQVKRSPAADHKRQRIWQIWVPLGASIALILALAILTVIGAFQQSPQVERWGNLSAVWVILPVLLVGIIFIAITAACVYGLSRLLIRVPAWMLKLQLLMVHLSLVIRRAADTATKPVMAVNGFSAQMNVLWRELFGKK